MISTWWLLLTIPACFLGGYILGGVMASGSQIDDCAECIYNTSNKEKSE